ncbi:MAG TPA: NUDIX domain-containing protein, partial [Polyangiaceae bacterium]|nr:NUDIX domain-containing protein [Polyangiaceae bacterium]
EHAGRVPRSVDELRGLPGIGPYSAGAIASIAFDADEPVVDGNVIRVLTRLFGLEGDPRREPLASRLWGRARELLPRGRAADFNQALMELGATVCTPQSPDCQRCPVAGQCRALALERVGDFPERPARPAPTEERRAAAVVSRRGRVLVVRASPSATRWAGMWQFPDRQLREGDDPAQCLPESVAANTGISIALGAPLGSLRHQVTRFRIQMDVYAARALRGRARGLDGAEVRWCAPAELTLLAMPVAHRKIARQLLVAQEADA